jgi:hypothetical protein
VVLRNKIPTQSQLDLQKKAKARKLAALSKPQVNK